MDFLRSCFDQDNRWIVGALLFGLAVLILTGLLHSRNYIRSIGLRNALRTTFRVEGRTWRVIGILLFLAMACAMMWSQWV
jgi:hypothetical protein